MECGGLTGHFYSVIDRKYFNYRHSQSLSTVYPFAEWFSYQTSETTHSLVVIIHIGFPCPRTGRTIFLYLLLLLLVGFHCPWRQGEPLFFTYCYFLASLGQGKPLFFMYCCYLLASLVLGQEGEPLYFIYCYISIPCPWTGRTFVLHLLLFLLFLVFLQIFQPPNLLPPILQSLNMYPNVAFLQLP